MTKRKKELMKLLQLPSIEVITVDCPLPDRACHLRDSHSARLSNFMLTLLNRLTCWPLPTIGTSFSFASCIRMAIPNWFNVWVHQGFS